MTARWLIVVLVAACGGRVPQSAGDRSYGRCLSPTDVRMALAHSEGAASQQAKEKLETYRLMVIYDDLVAARQAAATGAPPPRLTSGPCLPERLLMSVIFSGDEKPLQALGPERLYPTEPSPQNGLRDVSSYFPTTSLVDLVALPNVQNVGQPDPVHLIQR